MYFPGLIVWALELVNVQAGWCHTYPSVEKQGAEGMEILALSFFFSRNESGNTNTFLKF